MTQMSKILFGLFLVSSLISGFMVNNVEDVVAAKDDEKVDIDDGNKIQYSVMAENQIRFRFEEKTKVTFQANKPANLDIKCDGKRIGDKDFEIEVEADRAFNMTMNCKEEQNTKGLREGNIIEARNRVRYRYQEGFVADIECTEDCDAKLRIQETDQNRGGTWAYYDEEDEEWVPVETTSEDGYLECENDHFSTWTVLVPEIDYTLIILIGVGIGAAILIGAAIIIIKRRK